MVPDWQNIPKEKPCKDIAFLMNTLCRSLNSTYLCNYASNEDSCGFTTKAHINIATTKEER